MNPFNQGTKLSSVTVNPTEAKVVDTLSQMGISNVEHFISLAAIQNMPQYLAESSDVAENVVSNLVDTVKKLIPNETITALETPAKPHGLGANHEQEKGIPENVEMYTPTNVKAARMPSHVNRVSQMPAIRDQGYRGTCIAFGMTALHEFYLTVHKNYHNMSEQDLYYATKQVDGDPNGCGTWLSAAAKALKDHGQCTEVTWPYNGNPPCNQPGPSDPKTVDDEAAKFRVISSYVTTNDHFKIKQAIYESGVVAFSIPVYDSWYNSSYTEKTGYITLPLKNEKQNGGHAMCLVGYQDDTNYPGGGYFILRNSWSTEWGYDCNYGAGYGIISYEYIIKYCEASYTIV